ncbi:hypothetical protein JUN65_08235 [Gluconacetobacter azotocaptans]|nr:hypothetical protein [Gluconacetobacter azotocaptans]
MQNADRGTDGPAMLARRRVYDREVGADRMLDNCVLSFYVDIDALTRRQADAGHEVCRLYALAFGRPRVVADLGARGVDLSSPEDDEQEGHAWRHYNELMSVVPSKARTQIMRLVRGEFPDQHMGVSRLAEGLDRIADELRLAR